MIFTDKDSYEKRHFFYSLLIPLSLGLLMVLSFILEKGMGWDFHSAAVFPRRTENLWGIFTVIFIHADWEHLANNVISFVLLSSLLYFFYTPIATKVFIISYLISGAVLWVIGRESWHVGASGLIYSLAFFLFFSGVFRRHIPLIAISLIIAFVYGSMVWHIFPWQIHDPISWEGHLAGGFTGLLLSLVYRKKGPQKPLNEWVDEEDDFDDDDVNSSEQFYLIDTEKE